MRRRDFLRILGSVAILSRASSARALDGKVRRIGVMMAYAADDPEAQRRREALETELRSLNWIDGRNLEITYRWVPGANAAVLRTQARELVATLPQLILCNSTPVLSALREEHQEIPLVFVQVTDPVGAGFVKSLAKPGGDITGFTDFEYAIGGKWVELLKEAAPGVVRAAVVAMPNHAGNAALYQAMQIVAPKSGVSLVKIETTEPAEIERAITTLSAEPNGGLIVLPSPLAITQRSLMISLATGHHLPAVYPLHYFASDGGLMSYGVDQVDQWHRAASYVDRILRGESPANLPVQQPSKFELVINLKAAKALGLTVPPALLARADEIIE